jgi:hypothetical protein
LAAKPGLASQLGVNVGVMAHALWLIGFGFAVVRHVTLSKNGFPIMGILGLFLT